MNKMLLLQPHVFFHCVDNASSGISGRATRTWKGPRRGGFEQVLVGDKWEGE